MTDIPTGGGPGATSPQLMGEPLAAGDRVGRYVIDCYAGEGTFGQVYLAHDFRDDESRVIIKALRPDAPSARAVGKDERIALRGVLGHPQIVFMIDWLDPGPDDRHAASYLVLEHLSGPGLDDEIERSRNPGTGEVLHTHVPRLLRRVRGVLDGVAKVHKREHAINDIKPAHIRTSDGSDPDGPCKLIDLGAVAPFGLRPGHMLFASPGYCDPRLRIDGPSEASDIYAIGRTIMVAVTGVDPGRYLDSVPVHASVFERCPALLRLLQRATAKDPEDRFASVEELAATLDLVIARLTAVIAGHQDSQRVVPSPHFIWAAQEFGVRAPLARRVPGRESGIDTLTGEEVLAALPFPNDAPLTDPASGAVAQNVGLRSRAIRDCLERGEDGAAEHELKVLEAADPKGWRGPWFRAVLALRGSRLDEAHEELEKTAGRLPGELAPELALAATTELRGEHAEAGRLYQQVWWADGRRVAAAFGSARALVRAGHMEEAATTLLEAPSVEARIGAARALLSGASAELTPERFVRVQAALDGTPRVTDRDVHIEVLLIAWEWAEKNGRTLAAGEAFRGVPLAVGPVRDALGGALRELAGTMVGAARREMVDLANAVRRPTWW